MIHPDTRLEGISPEVGVGVVATRAIPSGTLVWVRDPLDTCLDDGAYRNLPDAVRNQFTRHAYVDEDGNWTLCWDIARFVNHSCDYNCAVTRWGLEIACRDIAAGEQLSNDYALFQLSPEEEFDCRCGSENCRTWVDSRHLAGHRKHHEKMLARAVERVMDVEQALYGLLTDWQIRYLEMGRKDGCSSAGPSGPDPSLPHDRTRQRGAEHPAPAVRFARAG